MTAGPRLVIGTAVPNRLRSHLWGDTFFAEDVAISMRRLGWDVQVMTRNELARLRNSQADLVLYLRGNSPAPSLQVPHALWVISHPSGLEPNEISAAMHLFSASQHLAVELNGSHLPQATNPERFRPVPVTANTPGVGSVLFVGNSRGQRRRVVDFAIRAELDLQVYGRKWSDTVPELKPHGRRIANYKLAASYCGARIVLNDHWSDMAEAGIVSNRIFDALACGAQVVTDVVTAMPQELREHLHVFETFDEFGEAIGRVSDLSPYERTHRGAAARAYVSGSHSFDQRAKVLNEILRQQL